jgi:hypothetical protein
MTRLLDGLRQRIADLLRDLASRPLSLFCLLLAANAVALPYGNFVHDANLYGLQVLNHVDPGYFAGDLYFQYGSQDQYSVFSLISAPIVKRLGLPTAFFGLYVLSNSLFLFAVQRFVRALIDDPIISTLSLLFLAITEIPFGGQHVFHINEWFLTPRIAANAFVVWGLERLLAGRTGQAWLLVLLALPLHPLMAFPGVLILAGWLAVTHLRCRNLLACLSLTALAVTALLLDRSFASRLLGQMDGVWRDSIHRVNPYHFPLSWRVEDWVRVALSLTVGLAVAWNFRERAQIRCLLLVMSGVAILGVVGGILACFLPYALPLQGQPWRWLWPLELALYPLVFLTAQRLWTAQHTAGRLAVLGLLAFLDGTTWEHPFLILLASSMALFGIVVWRGLSAQPRVADWAVRAAVFTFVLTMPLWTVFKVGLMAVFRQQLLSLLEPVEMLTLLATLIDPWCRLALLIGVLVVLGRLIAPGWRLLAACSGVCATACLLFVVLPKTHAYKDQRALGRTDENFVADYLAQVRDPKSTPMIYWPSRNIAFIWFDLRANIYLEYPHQIAGNIFNAGTAREAARRTQLIKKFEMERLRKERIIYSPWMWAQFQAVFQMTESEPAPQVDDLLELCREERLDFAVLTQKFPGLYAATNGKLFLYDCRSIRDKQQAKRAGSTSDG